MLYFRLRKFTDENFGIFLAPQVHMLQYHLFLAELIHKLLDHFGVIIKNPFATPADIFLIYYQNYHSDACNGSCLFLHTLHPGAGGVDVFKQQAPNSYFVHVHDPSPCIDLSFVCIVVPFALNRYCGIAREFLCLKQENYSLSFSPQ
jgi:hypothetical protein